MEKVRKEVGYKNKGGYEQIRLGLKNGKGNLMESIGLEMVGRKAALYKY